jgi:fucose 4-O-acetylase-like acetyltransferase
MFNRLLTLNGIATIMVALHHAAAYGYLAMFQWTNRYRAVDIPNYDQLDSLAYFVTLFIRQADSPAIPSFLFVSGFFVAFLAKGVEKRVAFKQVWPRIRKLLAPWVVWTIALLLLLHGARALETSWLEILRAYYFIPLVIQFYLLAPWLVPFVRKRPWLALALSALIQLAVQSISYMRVLGVAHPLISTLSGLTPLWFFPGRIFFFTMGVAAGLYVKPLSDWLVTWRKPLLTGAVLMLGLALVEHQVVGSMIAREWAGGSFNGFARTAYAVLFILAFFAWSATKLPGQAAITQLGGLSLGVYLMNTPVIYIFSSLMYHLTPAALGIQWIYQGVLVLTGLLVPVVVMTVMRRTPLRRVYSLVFG